MSTTNYPAFAREAITAYDLPEGARERLISMSENATFLVETDAPFAILRIYRADYQSIAAIESELAWIDAVGTYPHVRTPKTFRTRDGALYGTVEIDGQARHFAMFEYVPGRPPETTNVGDYEVIGELAAHLHQQVSAWDHPEGFERPTWDLDTILGDDPHWGDWRNGPGLADADREILEKVETSIREALAEYPQGPSNSGLVHGDLREANLIKCDDDSIWIIDFDDCGFSWLLWDLCSSTTFIEHEPHVDDIVDAWFDGYAKVRSLTQEDLTAARHLVFLRRLHILAWLGTHPESDLAHALGDTYTAHTVTIGRDYLEGRFLGRSRWLP